MNTITKIIFISIVTTLGGCAPQGQHYHNTTYEDAYDPIVYTPEDTLRPSYDHNYYRYDRSKY
jgi:hypothetical protein